MTAAMKRMFMDGDPLDTAVPVALAEQTGQPPVAGNHAWHVTYVFDRTVDVPSNCEVPPDSPYQWLDFRAWSDVDLQLRQEATEAFDALLAYTVGIITPMFFDHVALSLAMYYVAADGRFAMVPQSQGASATATVSQTSPFPSDALSDRLLLLGQQDWESHAWLGRVWSWHARALTEKPGWRLFMEAWTGLEILARKAGRSALPRHREREDVPAAVSKAMTYDHGRTPPLAADFAAMTLELSPDTSERDVARFTSIKDVRDRLVHGEPIVEESLPAIDARALLGEYIERATVRHIQS